jgi:hypothetical protein
MSKIAAVAKRRGLTVSALIRTTLIEKFDPETYDDTSKLTKKEMNVREKKQKLALVDAKLAFLRQFQQGVIQRPDDSWARTVIHTPTETTFMQDEDESFEDVCYQLANHLKLKIPS